MRSTTKSRPVTGPSLPLAAEDYYGFLRTQRYQWWKGLLGIAGLLTGMVVLGGLLGAVGLAVDLSRGVITPAQLTTARVSDFPMGPGLFIANNLALAALVPLSGLLNHVLFGQRPGWLWSVEGRFRWRWSGRMLLLVGLPWFALTVLALVLGPSPGRPVLSAPVLVVLVLMLVTTPLQSMGEEWAFRGFLARCVAAMVPDRRLGVGLAAVISSAVFMLAHSAADVWLNILYFGLGVVLFMLTWRTGGLEAAVVLHVVNNVTGLVPLVLTNSLASVTDRGAGAGDPTVLIQLVIALGLVLLVDRVARRSGATRRAAPGLAELAAPGAVPPVEDSGRAAPRVTLGPYEHRDDPQHGADHRP